MINLNKKRVTALKMTITFAIATVLAFIFMGCPQSKTSTSQDEATGIEGVWRVVSVIQDGKEQKFPIHDDPDEPSSPTMQPYMCFSEGKCYSAMKIENATNPDASGLFKGEAWEVDYTFKSDFLTIDGTIQVCVIKGNTLKITIQDGSDSGVMTLERVSSPTVAEIKAAKGDSPTPPPPPSKYVKVPYDALESYLEDVASSSQLNYIEVTGNIPKEDFKGAYLNPGELGKKLKNHLDKRVALKIESYPSGLTDMSDCFETCKNLISLENFPEAGLENLYSCFADCEELTSVPIIPKSVKAMTSCFDACKKLNTVILKCDYDGRFFAGVFENCNALVEKSIKVPLAYYANYTSAEALKAMKVPGDTVSEQAKKFEALKELNP